MAQRSAVIIEEDNFRQLDRETRLKLVEVVRWATRGTVGATRQNVLRYDAILTGDLWRSVHDIYTNRGTSGEVVVGVEYASYVHDGTRFMRPRPFLAYAIRQMAPLVQAKLEEEFE